MTEVAPRPQWLPKIDAAKLLGVSPRQLERHAAAGRIEAHLTTRERGRGKLALYARADLDAILAGAPNSHAVSVSARAGKSESKAIEVRKAGGTQTRPEFVPAILQQMAAAFAAPRCKPWLTLREAAEYSGLPAAWLRRQARSGAPCAVNVGSERAPRWRFSRELLGNSSVVRPA